MNIVIIGALPRSLIIFRGDLIRILIKSGHRVTAMAAHASPEIRSQIEALGAEFCSFPVQRNGLNAVKDLQTFYSLYNKIRQIKPDVIMAYTISRSSGVGLLPGCLGHAKFYGLITGLGFAFEGQGIKRTILKAIVSGLYRVALIKAQRVIFQNRDDLDTFVRLKIVSARKCAIVSGSGVNVQHFERVPLSPGCPNFLLIARLLGEKGIREYVRAAKKVKERYPDAVFIIVGPEDPSPDGIPLAEVQKWHDQGIIQYLGETNDVRPYLANCHVYVIPSYHEGMPRTVLRSYGYRTPYFDNRRSWITGKLLFKGKMDFWFPVRDANVLAERMIWFLEHRDQWERMGKRSLEMVEERFDVRLINREMMRLMGLNA